MDVEPRNPETLGTSRPRARSAIPIIGPTLARPWRKASRSRPIPIPLLRPDGPIGIVLAAPVMQEGATEPAGFVTFSYELSTADAGQ